MQGEVEIQ